MIYPAQYSMLSTSKEKLLIKSKPPLNCAAGPTIASVELNYFGYGM